MSSDPGPAQASPVPPAGLDARLSLIASQDLWHCLQFWECLAASSHLSSWTPRSRHLGTAGDSQSPHSSSFSRPDTRIEVTWHSSGNTRKGRQGRVQAEPGANLPSLAQEQTSCPPGGWGFGEEGGLDPAVPEPGAQQAGLILGGTTVQPWPCLSVFSSLRLPVC